MVWRWILFGLCMASALIFQIGLDIKDEDIKQCLVGFAFSSLAVILALIVVQIIKF